MPQGFWEGVLFLLKNYWPLFLRGVGTTLLISLLGTLFGFFLGMLLSSLNLIPSKKSDKLLRKVGKWIASAFSKIYVQVFRGTPMMVQAVLIYYGFMKLWGPWPAIVAGIVVVSMNTAAYISEIIRSGINAIDKGQQEAARSLGMTYGQTMWNIILPQAVKNVIPAIGNEFIVNVKDTSVLNIIAVTELFYNSQSVTMIFYRQFEVYFITSAIYLVITIISSKLLSLLDQRMGVAPHSRPSSQTVPLDKTKGGEF